MKKLFAFAAILTFSFLSLRGAAAQELASLTGVVSDNTGAVIEGVAVKLVDTKTNASYDAKTNSVGAYTFVKLLPGPGYKLSFAKDGFESLTVSNVYVAVGTAHTENVQLQVGKVTETIEVSGQAQAVTLNTTDATVGTNFDMNMVHELPIQNRDTPAALLSLQPGVVTAHAGSDDPTFSRDGAVTGARTDQTNVTLDGLDVNDFATGQAFSTAGNALVDSIQEFRGETANPLASSGRGSGAQVQLVTQSGSNSWHGALYEYHRNTVTEANNFFNARSGLPAPQLIRNQFGAKLGGPIQKDKLFFFFNYQGRREAREDSVLATVPLQSFRDGFLGYINNGPGCTQFSRANTQPQCITYVSNTSPGTNLTDFDPKGDGSNTAFLNFINSRYPLPNDLTFGDGVNTAGFRFNAPVPRTANDYVGRVDYTLNDKMKLFGRFSIARDRAGDDANGTTIQFPGDPVSHLIIDHSYAYVIGHTWTLSNTKVNNFVIGETRSDLDFPTTFNPVGTSVFAAFGPLSAPYSEQSAQHRVVPVPVIRDDFTYVRGKHNFQVGATFKPIKTRSLLLRDLNFVGIGLGGFMTNLDSDQVPADILLPTGGPTDPDPQAVALQSWESSFPFVLGRFASIFSRYDFPRDLSQPMPQGTGFTRHYRYYETEAYFQDTWRLRDDLTMTYGLRYQYYSVPYEAGGFEAIPNLDLAQFYNPRVPIGAAGDFSQLPPLLTYALGGKANHAAGLYRPDWKDFAPRLSFAYNPGADKGFFGKLLGDRKTVIRAGAGLIFDHPTTNAINFIQDQSNVFQASVNQAFGIPQDPTDSLLDDPRFTDINTIPPPFPPPSGFTPPPDGTANGAGPNYTIDRGLRTPYSIALSFGVQRELPGNFLLEADYFGRLGRRLLAQADAGQFVNFQDVFTPGHSLAGDFFDVTRQLRAGTDPSTLAEPFFEDFFGTGATAFFADPFVLGPLFQLGDLTDVVSALSPFLPPGIGLAPQFGTNSYITNKGSSSYNGLLMTLHKRMSHGLQFDLNYTYSHSLDNVSVPANSVFGTFNLTGGLVCNITNLRECRGNSDFDVTHIITGNFIYELPFGRGKRFGSSVPGWANQVLGGWQLSGIPSWLSGFAFTTVSSAFPISFFNNAPAIFVGKTSDLKTNIHSDPGTGIQLFANQANAINAFRGPIGLEGGSRNNLRGPRYTNLDLGLAKHFPLAERFVLEFRADAYNVFNHVNFGLPGTGGSGGTADITDPSSFGVINTAAAPRQIQFALRLDF